jgi:dTDP-4-amino-4,6-dideoxygalactose transaminase
VDIEPGTCNLDPQKIEAAITSRTTAILPVHCYGTPCDVIAIQQIADKHGLKVMYDAAHAFGVKLAGESVLRHGDLSILSFHATKVFNTFEGGAIVCPDASTKRHIDHLKNFGFTDEVTVEEAGINGKMNEFQSAMGLLQLKFVDRAIAKRTMLAKLYSRALEGIAGVTLFREPSGVVPNHSYFPILIDHRYALSRDDLYRRLRERNVYSRRYFYPLISSMPMYRDLSSSHAGNLPVASRIADQILCLPIYPALEERQVEYIVDVIRRPGAN